VTRLPVSKISCGKGKRQRVGKANEVIFAKTEGKATKTASKMAGFAGMKKQSRLGLDKVVASLAE
jgi:hypothetical protein